MKKQLLTNAIVFGTVAIGSLLQAAPAEAFNLFISPSFGSTETTGSTAELDFNFSQQMGQVLLDLGISNTTDGSEGQNATQSTLVGIGFDLAAITQGSYNPLSSNFTQLYNDNFPTITPTNPATDEGAADLPPFGSFDIGIRSSGPGNFTGGNPTQGLTAGNTASVQFLFDTSQTAAALEQAFLTGFNNGSLRAVGRFQQVNVGAGSDKVLGGTQPIPTPALLPGLIGMGIASLRKKINGIKIA